MIVFENIICADYSQNNSKTNKINIYPTKSLRIFFEDIFKVLLSLEFFVCLKNVKEKSFITLNLKCIPFWKHILWPNHQILENFFWNDQNLFFINVKKKNILPKKSFFVCLEEPMGDLWTHTKLCLEKCFIIFFTLMKYIVAIISRFFHKTLLVLHSNVFSHYNTFYLQCIEGLFLDVN